MRARRRPPSLLPAAILLLCASAAAGPGEIAEELVARRARRARLQEFLGRDYALVLGQPLTDVLQPRQEGHFLYLTGVDEPDASILLAGAKAAALRLPAPRPARAREVLFVRDADARFVQFYGLRHRPGEQAERALGIEACRAAPKGGGAALGKLLASLLPKRARLHLPLYRGPDHACVREVRRALVEALAESRRDVQLVDLHAQLVAQRSIKDAVELRAMERAVETTIAAFREALPRIRPGSTEGAVDGVLLQAMRARGALPAYPFVVAAGPHGAIPHYFRNRGPLEAGQLLVIDAGAAVDRYAADLTRVFPVAGRFTPRQREVYDVVLEAQAAAIAAVRPGAKLSEVDAAARRVVAEAGLAASFLHATCHHVGLDVHDPGPGLLRAGMTITVEPGVYLQAEGFGIRIEDLLLVTEKGSRVLSSDLPKEAGAVEEMLRVARADPVSPPR